MNTTPIKHYSYNKTITQLFEKAVSLYSENIAVYLEEYNITYRQFNEDINQLAHYLSAKGITRNTIVAVEIPRSYNMICTIFAIIKAGGAYLPLNPDFPQERKKQIIEDAQVKFLIVDSKQYSQAIINSCIILKLYNNEILLYSKKNLGSINQPQDIAYVIYTSGSTGKPKGVIIAHNSLINRIEWMQDLFPIDYNDILFQKTSCGFDVSIWEIFWWSITGAGVTLLPHGRENDIILMTKTIFENKVTVIHFVPEVLRIFLEYIEIGNNISKIYSLKFIFSSGEALDPNIVNHFNKLLHSQAYTQLINLYGPTEATIDVTYFICDKKTIYSEIPIGKPIYNTRLMILDDFLNPQPHGQIGELYISGVCLAKGYLNNPMETERCFIRLPNNEIIYKTGDLVKWNNNELCYIGRKDHQVKLNGIRIELGEIESHLKAYAKINHAIALYITCSSNVKKLVAFIKLKNKYIPFEIADLKLFMQLRLPNYMVPHDYVVIDQYPLKQNGKLDREMLSENYRAPR